MCKKSAQELGYIIPVKVRIDVGRYKYGYVKTLEPNKRGNLTIHYAGSGRISERGADTVIHEPKGFKVIEQPKIKEYE